MTTTPAASAHLAPLPQELGANKFTFTGDRTTITFFPQTPGPLVVGHEGGKMSYDGPEGNVVAFGEDITRVQNAMGHLLSIVLKPDDDTGQIDVTVAVPRVVDVTGDAPVTFPAVAVRTTRRGFVVGPGATVSYDVLPMLGTAEDVVLPL